MQVVVGKMLDEVHGLWRFRWWAMVAAWAVCIVGWLAVMSLPDTYEASARVFVDARTALTPVIQGLAISQDVNAQLNFVEQSLLSGTQMEKVAREANVDLQTITPENRAGLLDRLRRRVQLDVAGAGRDSSGAVFTIRYRDSDRNRSLKVTKFLLDTFIEDTLGGKRAGTETAQRFLEEQIEDRDSQLRAAEQRLAEFKKHNVGMMPGAQGDYFTNLQTEIDAIQKAQAALSIAVKRRDALDRQLRGEAPLLSTASAPAAGGTAGDETLARIKETQTKLDELLLKYTDKHPEVLALRETLVELQKRRIAEIEALRRGDPSAAAQSGATANPVFQSIQLASNQTDVEIAAIRAELADRQQKVADYRRLVDTVPEVEAKYARLNRDYEVTKAQYTALVERLERAKLGEQAGATGSVRFEVIDPPNVPFRPASPNRALLIAAVLVSGLVVGAGLAYLLGQIKPVFFHGLSLAEATGLPVLGVVSLMSLGHRQIKSLMSYLSYSAALAGLLVLFAAAVRFNDVGSHILRQLGGATGAI
jgi:polysaccharide chain length determinant protein (PEP-CTERM system associated)